MGNFIYSILFAVNVVYAAKGFKFNLFVAALMLGFAILSTSNAHAQDLSTMRNQTVLVSDDSGLGSGIVYDSTHILTANHVAGKDTLEINFFGRDKGVVGTVEKRWVDQDVALIRVDVPASILKPVMRCTKLMYGEKIYIVGMPLGLPWVLSEGFIASDIVDIDHKPLIIVDALVTHGNSGGPVFDSGGRVVGMSEAMVGDEKKEGPSISLVTPNKTLCNILGKNYTDE